MAITQVSEATPFKTRPRDPGAGAPRRLGRGGEHLARAISAANPTGQTVRVAIKRPIEHMPESSSGVELSDRQANRIGLSILVLIIVLVITTIVYLVWLRSAFTAVRYLSAVAILLLGWTIWAFYIAYRDMQSSAKAIDARIADAARGVAATEPAGVAPAWELARGTLDRYWSRNLSQNYLIFGVSIGAILAGFSLVLWSIGNVLVTKADYHVGVIGAAAGALTQFIGGSFLFLYKSTVEQAAQYNATLERINAVGMAWTILQTMPENSEQEIAAKNGAKVAIVTHIVGANQSQP